MIRPIDSTDRIEGKLLVKIPLAPVSCIFITRDYHDMIVSAPIRSTYAPYIAPTRPLIDGSDSDSELQAVAKFLYVDADWRVVSESQALAKVPLAPVLCNLITCDHHDMMSVCC